MRNPVFNLSNYPSAARIFIAELRDKNIQQDSMRFRRNLERLAEVLAYEISRTFDYREITTETVLGSSPEIMPLQQPVLVAVLRAALPFHTGFLNIFDRAENAFIGAYRSAHKSDHSFDVQMDYMACPDLEGKTIILIDPMLATGKSLVRTWEALQKFGKPAKLHVAAAIASADGIEFVSKAIPEAQIWTGAIDPTLNDHYYIVPGLGDAGDLAYGQKNS
ncbi:MAG: uracil phosphoribosyltransferase [Bacteroidota bacterium]